jgi:autotransporter-associated beta strand protein
MLNAGNAAGNENYNGSLGLDFNVNAGNTITITQLGAFAASNNSTPYTFASSHTVYIYQRNASNNTGSVLASVNATASTWNAARLTSDGYRFLPLATPLTLTAGTYMVVAEAFGTDNNLNSGIFFGGNAGTLTNGDGRLSFVGSSPYGSTGSYPTNPNTFPSYIFEYGAGNFVFNPPVGLTGRMLDDVIVNGPTAILDLGNNQNGYVGTVTLDGGGSITGSGKSTLNSRTSFQMKSGSVTAILGGAGTPLVKTTTGTVTLSGDNTYSGDTTVTAGTLRFNVTSEAATIASGATATVAAGATLELAGSVSALGTAGGNRVHIVNSSTASGVVVSGTNQVVGGIDGSGNVQINAGSDLTADHIIQGPLIISGTAGNRGLVTIDASDASGNPLGQPSGLALAGSLTPSDPFGADGITSTNLSSGGLTDLGVPSFGDSLGRVDPSSVPEPSTLALALLAVLGIVSTQFARHHFRCQSV